MNWMKLKTVDDTGVKAGSGVVGSRLSYCVLSH